MNTITNARTVCTPLQWRHNERDDVSNHRRLDCLLNCLFRRRSKKTSKFRVTGLCAGSSPVTGEFPAQRASNAAKCFHVSIWWRHYALVNHTLFQILILRCSSTPYFSPFIFTPIHPNTVSWSITRRSQLEALVHSRANAVEPDRKILDCFPVPYGIVAICNGGIGEGTSLVRFMKHRTPQT